MKNLKQLLEMLDVEQQNSSIFIDSDLANKHDDLIIEVYGFVSEMIEDASKIKNRMIELLKKCEGVIEYHEIGSPLLDEIREVLHVEHENINAYPTKPVEYDQAAGRGKRSCVESKKKELEK